MSFINNKYVLFTNNKWLFCRLDRRTKKYDNISSKLFGLLRIYHLQICTNSFKVHVFYEGHQIFKKNKRTRQQRLQDYESARICPQTNNSKTGYNLAGLYLANIPQLTIPFYFGSLVGWTFGLYASGRLLHSALCMRTYKHERVNILVEIKAWNKNITYNLFILMKIGPSMSRVASVDFWQGRPSFVIKRHCQFCLYEIWIFFLKEFKIKFKSGQG